MKSICLLAFVALMTAESQQINLNAKYGAIDCPESGCDDDNMSSKDKENAEILASLHEAEEEAKQAEKDKEAARAADFAKLANATESANVTANATIASNSTTNSTS